jgi:hypothetical protein
LAGRQLAGWQVGEATARVSATTHDSMLGTLS